MEFSYAIFNYTFIVRIPSLNSAMPAASFDVALSRLLHTVLSQACCPCLSRATWSGSLAYLCASVLSSSALHPVHHCTHPAPYLLYSLYSLHSPGTLQLSNLCLLLRITATVTAIVWPFVCLFNSPTMPLFHGMVQYTCYIQHIATYYTFMRTCEACFVFKKTRKRSFTL